MKLIKYSSLSLEFIYFCPSDKFIFKLDKKKFWLLSINTFEFFLTEKSHLNELRIIKHTRIN
jgi:hypothetical protein